MPTEINVIPDPLSDTLPPLAQAAATLRRCEIEEYEAQKAYQEARNRLHHLRGRIRSLGVQETLVHALDQAAHLRTARRRLEQSLADLETVLVTLDEARRQANARLVHAQHGYADVAAEASHLLRTVRMARRGVALAPSAMEALDCEEQAVQAQGELAALIGAEEAARLAETTERPAWLRG